LNDAVRKEHFLDTRRDQFLSDEKRKEKVKNGKYKI
jgi:hypothetical protein